MTTKKKERNTADNCIYDTTFFISDLKLFLILRLSKNKAYLSYIQVLTYSMPFNPFKVNKTCTASTTTCIKHKNDKKNQLQHLSPYMKKGDHTALLKDFLHDLNNSTDTCE